MENFGLGRVFGVLLAPTKTFTALRDRPSWLIAAIVTLVITTLTAVLLMQRVDMVAMFETSTGGAEINAAQLETATKMTVWGAPIAACVGGLLSYLGLALLFWVAFKALGSEMSYRGSLAVATHGLVPAMLVASVVSLPVILAQDTLSMEAIQGGKLLASNLGFFATDATSKPLAALLQSIDVFSLWSLSLLVIGYQTVAKVRRGVAGGVVVGLWSLYVISKVGLSTLT
jgi:hypothetical protein